MKVKVNMIIATRTFADPTAYKTHAQMHAHAKVFNVDGMYSSYSHHKYAMTHSLGGGSLICHSSLI